MTVTCTLPLKRRLYTDWRRLVRDSVTATDRVKPTQ